MHFNAAAEQWTRVKHNRVDVESVNEEVVWPAAALYPLTPRSPTTTFLSSALLVDSWKCIRIGKFLCHTDNLTRGGLIGHHYEITSLYSEGMIAQMALDVSSSAGLWWKVRFDLKQMDWGCVWKLSSITGHPCLTLTPYTPRLHSLKVTWLLISLE